MKPDSEKKVLIAYHAHCIDGFTSAWACWRGLLGTTSVFTGNIDFIEMTYDQQVALKNVAVDYDDIYIVDFSVSPEDLKLLASVSEIVMIDHHKTAIEKYVEFNKLINAEVVFNTNECGASLVWKYFFPAKPLPHLIQCVRDYDLWRFEFSYSKDVNKVLRLEKKDVINWQRLEGVFEDPSKLHRLVESGRAMSAYHNSVVKELVEQAEECTLN